MMKFTVDKSLCVGCGACIRTCPRGVFRPDGAGKMEGHQNEKCLECFHCTAICPTKAVQCSDYPAEVVYPEYHPSPLYSLMQKRRSTRNFSGEAPDRAFVEDILIRAGTVASAKNQRPTRWVVVLNKEKLDAVYRIGYDWAMQTRDEFLYRSLITLGRNVITCGAGCAVIGCCLAEESISPETDTAIALTTAELLFVEAGWRTCWSGYLRRMILNFPEARALMGIPEGYTPYAALLVGKAPAEQFVRPAFRPAPPIDWTE